MGHVAPCKQKGCAMKKIISMLALVGLLSIPASSGDVTYKVTLSLKVPRVYDNMESLGYRKMQPQSVTGRVIVNADDMGAYEPSISSRDFVNKTHKVSGKNVTYSDTEATDVKWRYIGSNKTGVFKGANVKFSLDLDPSYNIGEDEPDNTLMMTLAGCGSSDKSIKGAVTGQIGCGCKAYGHVSPTRTVHGQVDDIVPLYGTFTMKKLDKLAVLCR